MSGLTRYFAVSCGGSISHIGDDDRIFTKHWNGAEFFMARDIPRTTDPTSDDADRDSILVGFKVGAGLTICMAQLLAIAGQSGHVL
jgi:hypothetical protein